jgi:hypothetical protein
MTRWKWGVGKTKLANIPKQIWKKNQSISKAPTKTLIDKT